MAIQGIGRKVTKKAICIQMIDRIGGATLDEMAQAVKEAGLGDDLALHRRVAGLWMGKLTDEQGNRIEVVRDKTTGKYSRKHKSGGVRMIPVSATQRGSTTEEAKPIMHLTASLIADAFESYYRYYAQKPNWGMKDRLDWWELGRQAFDERSDDALEKLCQQIQKYWQAFRSPNFKMPTSREVRTCMDGIDESLRRVRLSDLAVFDHNRLQQVWEAIVSAGEIKKNKDGPSLVATSKFLHFWNPRLFLIVDRQIMDNFVFEHRWLWNQVEPINAILPSQLPAIASQVRHFQTNLRRLLAVQIWAGRVLQINKGISEGFATYVYRHAKESVPDYLATYDAAAMEWFLLGLVHVPPQGASFPRDDPKDI